MSVTSRIERAIKALEAGRLKEALYLTDKTGLEKHSAWVKEAAERALHDRKNAQAYMAEARDKLKATITAPLDDTSLEGVEEMLHEKSDDELYENCEECHIATAIVAVSEVCDREPQSVCSLISSRIDQENVQPEEWLKVLQEAAGDARGEAKREMTKIVGGLMEYLEHRGSPLLDRLKELREGD